MMSDNNKTILKISLFMYIIIEILSLVKTMNIEGINVITQFYTLSIPISTIILLVYASEKGEESICKIGIALIVINNIIQLLSIFDVVDTFYAEKVVDKIVKVIGRIASGGISMCSLLALFGIIPSDSQDRYEVLKTVAILCGFLYIIVRVVDVFVLSYNHKWLNFFTYLFSSSKSVAEYSFIIFYLFNKPTYLVEEIDSGNSIIQNTPVVPQVSVQQNSAVYNPTMQQPMLNQNGVVAPEQQTIQSMMQQPTLNQPSVDSSAQQTVQPMIQQPTMNQTSDANSWFGVNQTPPAVQSPTQSDTLNSAVSQEVLQQPIEQTYYQQNNNINND